MRAAPAQLSSLTVAQRSAIWLPFVLAVYILSIGPFAWLEQTCALPGGLYDHLYEPLALISQRSNLATRFFNWYECDLWGVAHSMDHPVPTAFNIH